MERKINKLVKIVTFTTMLVMIALSIMPAFAMDPGSVSIDESQTGSISTIGGQIIGIVTTIGAVISVLILVVLGIKYMLGSAEEKAEYKKTMLPYLIGAVLVFAASAIARVVYQFSQNIAGS